MSKNGKLIFKTYDPYVTSKFGYRAAIYKNGKLISKAGGHDGVDYGTNGKKLPQYAIEDGKVLKCGTDSTKAKFVEVYYPRLGMVGLHYHLDSYAVKKGQKVAAETVIGTTGTTGNSTGIHLHYGWYPYANRNKTWSKRGWKDFEKYEYEPPVKEEPKVEEPKPVVEGLKVGDKVKIISTGASTANGGKTAGGVGWTRYITKIHKGAKYPYQVGNKGKTNSANTTGFYQESDLKKV